MSFIQRELNKISIALASGSSNYAELYAAQQALAWAADPTGFASPHAMLTGILEGSEDCSDGRHPLQSSDTHCLEPTLR
jgi:hypothetical protein